MSIPGMILRVKGRDLSEMFFDEASNRGYVTVRAVDPEYGSPSKMTVPVKNSFSGITARATLTTQDDLSREDLIRRTVPGLYRKNWKCETLDDINGFAAQVTRAQIQELQRGGGAKQLWRYEVVVHFNTYRLMDKNAAVYEDVEMKEFVLN